MNKTFSLKSFHINLDKSVITLNLFGQPRSYVKQNSAGVFLPEYTLFICSDSSSEAYQSLYELFYASQSSSLTSVLFVCDVTYIHYKGDFIPSLRYVDYVLPK